MTVASRFSLVTAVTSSRTLGTSSFSLATEARAITGCLRASLAANGMLEPGWGHVGVMDLEGEARAWKTIWSAGHGVGASEAIQPARALCEALVAGYRQARA